MELKLELAVFALAASGVFEVWINTFFCAPFGLSIDTVFWF
jgi:hypothetical protein